MLTLPIHRNWFDMISAGIKTEEYRDIKPFYTSRFRKVTECNIMFRNGYSQKSPTLQCAVSISCGEGREEWGATPGKTYYVLRITRVEKIIWGPGAI